MVRKKTRDHRSIALARALHARLFVDGAGRVLSVSGEVACSALAEALAHQDQVPAVGHAPLPQTLGFEACDGELSPHLLNLIGVALNRWRLELAAEKCLRPAQRRRGAQIAREEEEIRKLTARWQGLRAWQAQIARGEMPKGAPYFLDAAAEQALQSALRQAQKSQRLPPLIAWQARIIHWLSGFRAMQRYLHAMGHLLAAYPAISRLEKVRQFQRNLFLWKRRAGQEPFRQLLAEMKVHLAKLPAEVVREGQFSCRLKGRSFDHHCDLLLEKCAKLLAVDEKMRWHVIPADLAALAAADGSAIDLPQRCFRAGAEAENFDRLRKTIREIAHEIGRPGYDAMLAAIDLLPPSVMDHQLASVRHLLDKGHSLAETIWACEMDLQDLFYKAPFLSLRAAQRLLQVFAERGAPLLPYRFGEVVRSIRNKTHLAWLHAWLAWLGSVSPRTITPKLQAALERAFCDVYLPRFCQPGKMEEFAPLLAPAARSKDPGNVAPLLARIADYQRALGNGESIPKTLRKLLDWRERRQRELAHLKALRDAVGLNTAAELRLISLEEGSDDSSGAGKIRRSAEESFLTLGIDALMATVQQQAEKHCRATVGDLLDRFPRHRWIDLESWIESMEGTEREHLRELVAAAGHYGRNYKRQLADNQAWLAKAEAQGIDLAPWLAGPAEKLEIEGRKYEIAIGTDLLELFQMGTYFRTCLSIGEPNQRAVVTNAYDANKQVVFLYALDAQGERRVVGRQLIAISSEFKLVGYNTYFHWNYDDPKRQQASEAMGSFSARLAARCGIELSNGGTPETHEQQFWYDDGTLEWPASACEAWNQASTSCRVEKLEMEPATC